MKVPNNEILQNSSVEAATKLLYCFLMIISKSKTKETEQPLMYLCNELGLNRHQIYRARSQLRNLGVLEYRKKWDENTGKNVKDVYKILN